VTSNDWMLGSVLNKFLGYGSCHIFKIQFWDFIIYQKITYDGFP